MTLPTERNWDLRKLNTSQAQNFSLGSREGILSSGPPRAHLIRRSVPSPASFLTILHSRCLSVSLGGGSDISLTSNTAVNSFCAAVLDSGVTLESYFWEWHTAGVKGKSARAGSVLSLNVTNAYRHRIEQFSNYINPSAGCHISSATRSLLSLIRFRPIEKSVVTLPLVSCHNSHQHTMHLLMYNR